MALANPAAESQQLGRRHVFGDTEMGIFERKKQASAPRRPSETVQLTDSLSAAIWIAEEENGRVRISWDMSRLSDDKSKTYKTKTLDNLLETPLFIQRMSEFLAESSAVPEELRMKLARQAVALQECLQAIDESSSPKVNGHANGNRVFAG